jgi:hypothetical protein
LWRCRQSNIEDADKHDSNDEIKFNDEDASKDDVKKYDNKWKDKFDSKEKDKFDSKNATKTKKMNPNSQFLKQFGPLVSNYGLEGVLWIGIIWGMEKGISGNGQ